MRLAPGPRSATGWFAVAVAVLVLAGCGGHDSSPLQADSTTVADDAQPSDRAAAEKDLRRSVSRLLDAGTGRFTSETRGDSLEISTKGSYDLDAKRLEVSTSSPVDDPDVDLVEFGFSSIVVADDSYAQPSAGPMSPCWVHSDRADRARVAGTDGAIDPVPGAVTLLTYASADGFISGKDTIRAMVPAEAALGIFSTRFLNQVYAELPDDEIVLSEATIVLRDSDISTITFEGADVLEAFEDSDVDLSGGADEQTYDALAALLDARVDVTLADLGDPVMIERPETERLMESSAVANGDERLCAAAR